MSSKYPAKPQVHSEEFLRHLIQRQLRLSCLCGAAFGVVLVGLPLLNYFEPELMAQRILGFTMTWLLLGISFFPAVWCIAFYFIRRSIRMEDEEVREVQGRNPTES